MSGTTARNRAQEAVNAFESNEVVGLGKKKAQQGGGTSVYVPYPQPHARHDGVEPKSTVEVFYSGKANALIVVPAEE